VDAAESVAPPRSADPTATYPTDDGGIWRRAGETIDLSSTDNLPARAPLVPAVAPTRVPRTTLGDGYPSRDALDSNAPIPKPHDEAHHAAPSASTPRLPLFRPGSGNGNGHGNGQAR
jgi:hypothetical protein